MAKRKREESLADQVLQDKLDFLKSKGVTLESARPDVPTFDYLLEVCLAEAKLVPSNMPDLVPEEIFSKETKGEYDYAALQAETLIEGTAHAPFVGPVSEVPLPGPKVQGVVATRDIQKGELLCASPPTIVAQNLAAVDDPSPMIFSDLSRAEMTASLIRRSTGTIRLQHKLDTFEYAGKEDDASLKAQCTSIISKYTWAIDHPHNSPGFIFKGKHTKVAGHAFTILDYAGKFNHSCVPNATMVSYGSVQFFKANVSIPKDTEICVSYGYDVDDDVTERRRKLQEHAGFLCDCPLCTYQLKEVSSTTGKRDMIDNLQSLVMSDTTLGEKSLDFFIDKLQEMKDMVIGANSRSVDVDLLEVLLLQPKVAALAESRISQSNDNDETLLAIKTQIILLYVMLTALELPRDRDIGISFGDMYRREMQQLATLFESKSWRKYASKDNQDEALQADWWRDRSMEYTDCF